MKVNEATISQDTKPICDLRTVTLIRVLVLRGKGIEEDPIRQVAVYSTLEGRHLFTLDPAPPEDL